RPAAGSAGKISDAKGANWRFRVPDGEGVSFTDGFFGSQQFQAGRDFGDFVVWRHDDVPSYQLAVVVDDGEAGVTQVVRGSDLLFSTPRQIHLQRLLGYAVPGYCHLPLVTGPNGAKLSKRENAVSIASGRNLQHEGGALLVAALCFLGQEPPVSLARASCREILAWGVARFDFRLIPQHFASFPAG
ncbi:MAG: glutamate--tRNA ligase family protein, partial [Geobacteraceae bacterium]